MDERVSFLLSHIQNLSSADLTNRFELTVRQLFHQLNGSESDAESAAIEIDIIHRNDNELGIIFFLKMFRPPSLY